jgi:tRNA 2-selenouridine synthase
MDGQDKAIALGLEITKNNIEEKIEAWLKASNKRQIVITCARGGLRSQFAEQFLNQKNVSSLRVQKGYKALRNYLLAQFTQPHSFFVLSGATGSGKTALIQDVPELFINLEYLAKHRGSVFGEYKNFSQPSQGVFENSFALEILKKPIFGVEDESLRIGQVTLPPLFKEEMKQAPVVLLECSLEERIERIFIEYVEQISSETLLKNLTLIKKHLGGALYQEICEDLKQGNHFDWIKKILEQYYDKKYQYAFKSQQRKVLLKGSYSELKKVFNSSAFFSAFQFNSSPIISATL